MNNNFEIIELKEITSETLEELSLLLMDVVNSGASVGFLAPLSLEVSKEYWSKVLMMGLYFLLQKLMEG